MTNNLPTIDIKGKKYVLVSERVLYFNETYKNGSVITELLSPADAKTIIVKATVTPDNKEPNRFFVGHSQATIGQGMVNTTSALENAETSAVGRALGLMGIGVIESIASADEIVKAQNSTPTIEYVKGKVCPKDKGRLIIGVTKAGKKFHKCENAKWDTEQHKNIGCDYVDWLNMSMPEGFDKKNPYKTGGIPVEEYENYQG